ncbi:glycosyltransferase family 4 protein [Puniceicoccales bacterium CK1056]|uniref:Glycosyltransferase family 4 protein n=1 Tax=Oceanipulchritudo coccoides TaxID=2706888 RepID=A0A6B2LYP8_9BACT|nr:glycosyltransferase family 4 protein [Oceanipulchritudo coccoides]NDV61738.1 glycosyltransferase family 4 protein [Oceanipulchritudo coccoides]
MKIIQILPELNSGGVERGTLEIGRYLVEQGHESVVISNGGKLVKSLVEDGSRHITLPVHKKSLLSLSQVKVLRKVFEDESPDIIHVRSRLPAWITWLAWRRMDRTTRPRLVTTVHGFNSVNAYSRIMTRGELVITVSDSCRQFVLTNYPETDPSKIRVVHRGVDPGDYPNDFQPSQEWRTKWHQAYPETANKILITLPGRVTRLKGHADFIQIIQSLVSVNPRIHGIIAGGAHEKKQAYLDEIREEIKKAGLADHITITGHRSDLREVLGLSDIVLSLTTQPESFGRTTLEALCLSTPVIGYEHGGVGEILQAMFPEGRVPFGDREKLTQLIIDWLDNGFPSISNERPFTLEAMQRETLECYKELAAQSR